ncbi:hypothetical protein LV89_01997 [Arcicella aurantiaca]|uniref:Uncharacterized protein n=1 Tax=Arcicella aurantiaca TaxID=591202 RepID=A0A316EAM4_9BACT|nr:hypothetical protein [Arcicella aurantiaca]PWK27182.1 hypothetical protein LV89_01997 [Arcicella aurantiaca]
MKKQVKTSQGLEVLTHNLEKNKPIELSEAMSNKLAIINFFSDLWEQNKIRHIDEQMTRREIIEKAFQVFNVDYSSLYRIWNEGQEKLGFTSIMPKNALQQYIINKAMMAIDRIEGSAEPDERAHAVQLKNLREIHDSMPDIEEEREPLPTPIFVFNPELLANHSALKGLDIAKIVEELRASDDAPKRKTKKTIGEAVPFQEL